MKIVDDLKLFEFKSECDNSIREVLLAIPANFKKNKKYPIIISPHPFGFSNFENYAYGTPAMIQPFSGWKGIPSKYSLIVALPFGHGRVYDKISLSWEAQLEDISIIPKVLNNNGYNVSNVYIGGLSMGGMESLSALGKYPDVFDAGFSFNGVADLGAWFEDIKNGLTDKELVEMNIIETIEKEVGGTPDQCPEEYKKRSAINYIDNLSKKPLMIYWSSKEDLAANQESKQTKKLYDLIKKKYPNSEIFEYDHSFIHSFIDFSSEERFRCHEFADFEIATKWLLNYG